MNPWLAMLAFSVTLMAVMWTMRVVRKRTALSGELSRKIVHVFMGLATLSFPWLFTQAWPVVVLSALTIAFMATIRLLPVARSTFGPVLGDVSRFSLGEFYYPLAVAILFALSGGDPVLYCVPLLILTLADALAALIGTRYGTLRYDTFSDRKSVEGSIAFVSVAFLSTHVPLLLATDTGRLECLLIACTVALLAALLEAIAWRGLDNLLIPLGAYIMLRNYLDRSPVELASLLAVTIVLFLFVMVWRRRTTLKDSALIGGVLVGYLCFSWGGWEWLVAPIIVFSTYTLLWPPAHDTHPRRHDLPAVISVTSVGIIWLVLSKSLDRPEYVYPYTLSFAAHLAMIGMARVKHARPSINTAALLSLCVAKGWLVLFVPFVLVESPDHEAASMLALVAPLGVLVAAAVFQVIQPGLEHFPIDSRRWVRQGISAAAGSLLGLIPLFML